jgi:hypothetical protein
MNHAGIPVGSLGNTVGFYHGNEGFCHGFSGRFPAGYRRGSCRALESCRVQESRRFYLHRVDSAGLKLDNVNYSVSSEATDYYTAQTAKTVA